MDDGGRRENEEVHLYGDFEMKRKTMIIFLMLLMSFSFGCSANSTNETDCSDKAIEDGNATQHLIITTEEPTEEESHVDVDKSTETETHEDEPEMISEAYSEEDLYVMAHVIMGEAGGNSWDLKIGVGSVVLNRVKDERFPNTIYDVVFQNGQYACTWDGNYNKEPTEECYDAALFLLENGSQMPDYVIWQAEFLQGDGVYEQIENTFFCYNE